MEQQKDSEDENGEEEIINPTREIKRVSEREGERKKRKRRRGGLSLRMGDSVDTHIHKHPSHKSYNSNLPPFPHRPRPTPLRTNNQFAPVAQTEE